MINPERKFADEAADAGGGLLALAVLALIAGAASGLVGALFRLSLMQADGLRNALITWAHGEKPAGFLLVTATCAAATAVAAWLVRRYSPYSSGSGITHVEAVLQGDLPQAPFRLIPMKFSGGVLAIGSGLALGPEGPSVQMGASFAHLVGKVFRRNWTDCRVLLAAGAGAGFAAAFNAPIAGAVFVLEELVRRFELRIAIAALGASASAIWLARLILGDSPQFHVAPLHHASFGMGPLYLMLGVVAGLLGIIYNRTITGALALGDRLTRWPVELRAGLIGAGVGILAWFTPELVGDGEAITQRTLSGAGALELIPLVFLFRFGLGAVSYASGTPGGLLAPMLVLGSQLGLFVGIVSGLAFPGLDIQPEAFAVVGMAAFFTAVARTPLTSIILITEMTGNSTLLLPMLVSCFAAMQVPTMLGNEPLYDSLRQRTMASQANEKSGETR